MEKQPHQTVMDYLRWRGDLSFTADPFNEVDQLILCILAYLNYRRFPSLTSMSAAAATPLHTLAPLMRAEDEQQGLSQLEYLPLLQAAAESPRFRDVGVFGYVTEHDALRETQFDAVSFALPDKTIFCAFMGTDTSIAGWKEDLNLSFLNVVPAQRKAVEYVEAVAANRGKLRLGGHSKGGHLALYAALYAPQRVQRRIVAAYNNDGPGFRVAPWQGESYRRMAQRIHTYIPAESIVGVLLDQVENYTVVSSHERFLLQHEPLSWEVEQNHLKALSERTPLGQITHRVTASWLAELSVQERQDFADALYDILCCEGRYTTLEEVWQNGGEVLRCYRESGERKAAINAALDQLKTLWRAEIHRLAEQEMLSARQGLKEAADTLRRKLLSKKKK